MTWVPPEGYVPTHHLHIALFTADILLAPYFSPSSHNKIPSVGEVSVGCAHTSAWVSLTTLSSQHAHKQGLLCGHVGGETSCACSVGGISNGTKPGGFFLGRTPQA